MSFLRLMSVLLLMGGLSLGLTGTVFAQAVDPNKINKLPHFDSLTDEQFMTQTDLLENRSEENPEILAYEIRVPNGWVTAEGTDVGDIKIKVEKSDLAEHEKTEHTAKLGLLGGMAKYFGPATLGVRSRIDISVQRLTHDISARNWFMQYTVERGYPLEGMEATGDKKAEGLYIEIKNDITYVVRVVVEINGPYLTLVSYFMPASLWNEEKALQEKVIGSFHFFKTDHSRISEVKTFSFMDFSRVDYPEDWQQLKPAIKSLDDMAVKFISTDERNVVNGEIDVHLLGRGVAGVSLSDEIIKLKENMKERGIFVSDLLEKKSGYEVYKDIHLLGVEVYLAKGDEANLSNHEYWIAVFLDGNYYYIVTMLTIGRKEQFYTWALNEKSFETVVETIRP